MGIWIDPICVRAVVRAEVDAGPVHLVQTIRLPSGRTSVSGK
jgi:hypothetical protein